MQNDTLLKKADTEKTHIVLVSNTGWNIVRYRDPLIKGLIRRGARVTVIANVDADHVDALMDLGAETVRIPLQPSGRNPVKDLGYLLALRRFFKKERPDVVHFFTVKPVIYGSLAARLAGIRTVRTITGRGLLNESSAGWMRLVVFQLTRLALAGRGLTIFQNDDDRQWFAEHGLTRPENARVIQGSGVDTRALTPNTDIEPKDRRSFVMASRMLWSKGVEDFVAAAREVRKTHPDVTFSMYGGSSENYGSKNPDFIPKAWLEGLKSDDVVQWCGWTPPADVEAAMQKAAAVILPSRNTEGVARALIEAAAVGAPIITTDMPGCRDTVVAGRSGFVVPVASPERIAAAMRELLDDPAKVAAMGEASRDLAVSTFDSELIVEQTFETYRQCLDRDIGRMRSPPTTGGVRV